MLWHKLGEVVNECTSHNSIMLAIFVPKIIIVRGNLTKLWQNNFDCFLTLCTSYWYCLLWLWDFGVICVTAWNVQCLLYFWLVVKTQLLFVRCGICEQDRRLQGSWISIMVWTSLLIFQSIMYHECKWNNNNYCLLLWIALFCHFLAPYV